MTIMKNVKKYTISKEAREAKNKYYREYRKKNPEKVKKYIADYWERKANENKSN